MNKYSNLPAAFIIEKGNLGLKNAEFYLLKIAAPRLSAHGIKVPSEEITEDAELALYKLLLESHKENAYYEYKSLIQSLVSLQNALDFL